MKEAAMIRTFRRTRLLRTGSQATFTCGPLIEPYERISRIRLTDSLSSQSIHEELRACLPYK